jgi:hypothetical protein
LHQHTMEHSLNDQPLISSNVRSPRISERVERKASHSGLCIRDLKRPVGTSRTLPHRHVRSIGQMVSLPHRSRELALPTKPWNHIVVPEPRTKPNGRTTPHPSTTWSRVQKPRVEGLVKNGAVHGQANRAAVAKEAKSRHIISQRAVIGLLPDTS